MLCANVFLCIKTKGAYTVVLGYTTILWGFIYKNVFGFHLQLEICIFLNCMHT